MADKDFVVKNGLVVNTNVLVAMGTKVGVNTASPDAALTVAGTANLQGNTSLGGNDFTVSANSTFNGNVVINSNTYFNERIYIGNNQQFVPLARPVVQAVDNFNGFVQISSQNLANATSGADNGGTDACSDMVIIGDDSYLGYDKFLDIGYNNSNFDGSLQYSVLVGTAADAFVVGSNVYQLNATGGVIAYGNVVSVSPPSVGNSTHRLIVTSMAAGGTYVPTQGGVSGNLRNQAGVNSSIVSDALSHRNYPFTIAKSNDGYLYLANGALTIGTSEGGRRANPLDPLYDPSGNPLIFHTNGMLAENEVGRWLGNGNFIIGPNTTSRAAKLNVNGSANIAGVTNVGANLNVAGNVVATGNMAAVTGLFSASVNVGSQVSLSSGGLVSANVTTDFNTLKIAGTTTVSSVNVAAGNLTIGNTTVTNAPLVRLINSQSSANLTTVGLQTGNSVVNTQGVYIGANSIINTSAIFLGNASSNVVISPYSTQALSVTGNASVGGNLTVTGGLYVTGPTVSVGTQTSAGDFNPSANIAYNLGSTSFQWANIFGLYIKTPEQGFALVGNSTQNTVTTYNSIKVSNTVAVLNLSPIGLTTNNAVVNNSVISIGNTSLTTAVQMIVANTSGATTVNATSVATTSLTGNLVGNVQATVITAATSVAVGSNVTLSTANLAIGNSIANVYVNSTAFVGNTVGVHTGNVVATTLSGNLAGNVVATTISGNLAGNVAATTISASANVTVGANVLINTSSAVIGNASLTTAAPQIIVANSSGVTVINSTSISAGLIYGTLAAPTISATTVTANLVGNVQATVLTGNLTGNVIATTVNATTMNAATFQVGSVFVANSDGVVANNMTINGNLTVLGTFSNLSTTTLDVKDINITIAKGVASAAAATGAGFTVDGVASFAYVNSTNTWLSNVGLAIGNSSVNVYANSTMFVGNTVGLHTGNVVGNVAAVTLSASANITLGSTIVANTSGVYASHLATQPASNYLLATENKTLSGNIYFTGSNNYFSNMPYFNAGTSTSNSVATVWLNNAGGAIAMDTYMAKRISWNDGNGNFNIRVGHFSFYNSGDLTTKEVYQSDGTANFGAAKITMASDNFDGGILSAVAPKGVDGTQVSFSTYTNLYPNQFDVAANVSITGNSTATGYTNASSFRVGSTVVANTLGTYATHLRGEAGANFVNTAQLSTTLGSYVTTTALNSTLGSYATTASLASASVAYATNSGQLGGYTLQFGNVAGVAGRDGSGDLTARLFRAEYASQSNIYGSIAFRGAEGAGADNYTRYCNNPAAVRGWLGLGTASLYNTYWSTGGPSITGSAGDTWYQYV